MREQAEAASQREIGNGKSEISLPLVLTTRGNRGPWGTGWEHVFVRPDDARRQALLLRTAAWWGSASRAPTGGNEAKAFGREETFLRFDRLNVIAKSDLATTQTWVSRHAVVRIMSWFRHYLTGEMDELPEGLRTELRSA
jgi:hypothetical protein